MLSWNHHARWSVYCSSSEWNLHSYRDQRRSSFSFGFSNGDCNRRSLMAISKKPFLPNLNVIRSQKQAGGYEVAESLDAISTAIEGLHVISSGLSQQVAAVRGSVGEVQTQVVKVVGAAAAAAGSQVPFQPVSVTANAVIGIIDLGSESGPVVRVFDATAQVNVPWAGPN